MTPIVSTKGSTAGEGDGPQRVSSWLTSLYPKPYTRDERFLMPMILINPGAI